MNPLLNIASRAAINSSIYMLRCLDQLDTHFLIKKNQHIKEYLENIVTSIIKNAYPNHHVNLQDMENKYKENIYNWAICIISGQNNFNHKIPIFSISIAIIYNKRVEHGLIYDPVKNEMFTASRNEGAKLNNKRIRLPDNISINNSIVNFSVKDLSLKNTKYNTYKVIEKIGNKLDLRSLGNPSLSLAYLSTGRISGYFEQISNVNEIAAGALIAKESGAYVSDYRNEGEFLKNKNIVAAHPQLFPYIIENIIKNKN